MLTKVGIYTLFRCLVTLMPHHLINIYDFILILSIPTMIIGIMGALYTKNIERDSVFQLSQSYWIYDGWSRYLFTR